MATTRDEVIAELQRANAELRRELDAALARRGSEYDERIAHQSATIDVLKVMSASPGDPQPVFDLIVERARELCGGFGVSMFNFDGKLINLSAASSSGISDDPAVRKAVEARFPMAPTRGSPVGRAIIDGRTIRIDDMGTEPGLDPALRNLVVKSTVSIPFIRDGIAIGAIALGSHERGGFSDTQVDLLKTFAEQAVIEITSAETYRALQTRTADLQESLEQQTATAEVLGVINRSPGDLAPVFDAMLEKVMRLCEAGFGELHTFDGDRYVPGITRGVPAAYAEYRRQNVGAGQIRPGSIFQRINDGMHVLHIPDLMAEDHYRKGDNGRHAIVNLGGARTLLAVALRKDETCLGIIAIYRQEVRPFSDKQIALLENFAAQAVIAIENARLITEQREALEQQTATAEVLQVINASPGNLTPVFDAMLEKAMRLCGAAFGEFWTFEGEHFKHVAARGVPAAYAEFRRTAPNPPGAPGTIPARIREGENVIHVIDLMADEIYRSGRPSRRAMVDLGGARTMLIVALRKDVVGLRRDEAVVGCITIYRQEVRAFSEKEISLLENFAAQAVIAMENARLLGELRERTDELARRQAELRVTFENMGDGVAMFDETQHLAAWNRKFQDLLDVPDDIIARRQTFAEYVRYLAGRGEYGTEADPEEQVRRLLEQTGQYRAYERTRPNGRIIEIRHNPVRGGGFVLIYADITERKRNEEDLRSARDAAEAALRDLKTAQANLIQAEKMASLGQLTAGIAHEIKNPLNFVNNFASLSVDLLSELKETAAPAFALLDEEKRADIEDISATLTSNLGKITEHGKRADGIVKAMLEHSRGASGERRTVDINALADEALNLAYHGARAQDQSFNIALERDFADGIAPIEVNPQDITRVFLNLFSNGFYAANQRARHGTGSSFEPTLKVTTHDAGDAVEIRVRDNGTGIPADIIDKLFQPFFTTKPTSEGTGLGLSITYDIVTKAHGGTITVESEVDTFTEFVVTRPRKMFAVEGDRA
jgi:two-component system NtrC family sensor kinase